MSAHTTMSSFSIQCLHTQPCHHRRYTMSAHTTMSSQTVYNVCTHNYVITDSIQCLHTQPCHHRQYTMSAHNHVNTLSVHVCPLQCHHTHTVTIPRLHTVMISHSVYMSTQCCFSSLSHSGLTLGLKSGTSACKLISTLKRKHAGKK